MAENTNEVPLENPTNNKLENSLDETNSTTDTETIKSIQETENMEVHHHAHHAHGKKTWKNYFWEFLMLFLAVFCGFLAETYHTHLVNKGIEKRNIENYITNIENDQTGLIKSIKFCEEKIKLTDSLIKLNGAITDSIFEKQFFYYALKLTFVDFFTPDESAFLQMQSSNSLRLVETPKVVDSILSYHQKNIKLVNQKQVVERHFNSALDNLVQIADFRNFANLKFNKNSQQVYNYINYKIAENLATHNYLDNFLKKNLASTSTLIPFLKKEYSIK